MTYELLFSRMVKTPNEPRVITSSENKEELLKHIPENFVEVDDTYMDKETAEWGKLHEDDDEELDYLRCPDGYFWVEKRY